MTDYRSNNLDWCKKEIRRKSGNGQTGISHGICPDCLQKLKERRE